MDESKELSEKDQPNQQPDDSGGEKSDVESLKKRIEDPTRPEGFYYGYDSAAECMADYEADLKKKQTSDLEAVIGYTCLGVFLAVIVLLSVIAGLAR